MNGQQLTVWSALECFFGAADYECDAYMYMGTVERDGVTIYLYKHRLTRRYLNIGNDARTYRYDAGPGVYRPISRRDALAYCLS